ncbi:hypothetical protein D187_005907 [Cystobacter fuscus DSM 2262]|uniref:Uncharacterized protein n=1 Tax=Cystobacter fuscus (strain ATCC 25194 / DSM 2262 / NBRC 100088 / M29) TaxID=1242864 RepID=S9PKF9_CYSF2|nr:hypothetical protein D187_005907 [Cystobacter fuscus DSM 2262]
MRRARLSSRAGLERIGTSATEIRASRELEHVSPLIGLEES